MQWQTDCRTESDEVGQEEQTNQREVAISMKYQLQSEQELNT